MNEDRFRPEEIPAEWLAAGVDVDQLPSRSALQAIPRDQARSLEGLLPEGESAIIDLGWVGGLFVFWRIDGRGITVGMRLKLLGQTHELGAATIDQRNPVIEISGPDIFGYQATLRGGVETRQCKLFLGATLKCGQPINDTFRGELGIVYGRPWPEVQPGTISAEGITRETADALRSAPERQFAMPRPGFVQSDQATSLAVRTLLWLVNGQPYIEATRLGAEALQAEDALADPNDLLLAIGLGGQMGVGVGVAGAIGVYITGGGEVGWFGSGGIDLGYIFGISGGVAFYLFWTGTRGFGGASIGVNISVGKGLGPKFPIGPSVTVTFYWTLAPRTHSLPAGVCFMIGIGASPIPVAGYITFGYTYVQKLGQVWNLPAALPSPA